MARSLVAVPAIVVLLGSACASPSARQSSAAPVDVTREANAASASTGLYFEFQVEKPVLPAPGGCNPRYPVELRTAGTNGEVVGLFVVDTAGLVEPATFRVIRSSHGAFTTSVREALACMRFQPATIKGRRVRQWVQQPFTFEVAR